MTRDQFNVVGGTIAAIAAAASLVLAASKGSMPKDTADHIGKIAVAVWAILPPAFFWIDWVFFCGGLTPAERDIAKHTHDLARNIWLGLLAVLTLGFFKLVP